jgi:hypothetical protein
VLGQTRLKLVLLQQTLVKVYLDLIEQETRCIIDHIEVLNNGLRLICQFVDQTFCNLDDASDGRQ